MKKTIPHISIRASLVFTLFLLLPALSISAIDFGLFADQTLGMEGVDSGSASDGLNYSASLVPWLSSPLGSSPNAARLYLSAGLTLEYAKKNAIFIPELLRTELLFPIGTDKEIKIGRMRYADPLGFIASGLFDGARFSYTSANSGTVGLGVWYTGLLYKKNTQITMTGKELVSYNAKLDYENFVDTYFAPRRLLFALDWDNPYLAEWFRFKTALIGQVDLSGDEKLHSEYLALRAGMPVRNFVFDLGACLELAQAAEQNKVSFAGELGIGWMLPTPVRDKLTLTGRFSNGKANSNALAAFVPVTTENQGYILKAKLSGLSTIRLDYIARLHESFSLSLASTYFIMNDSETYNGLPSGRAGPALGNEFYGRLIWSPLSDLRFNLGGGVFLPVMGNADSGGKALWRVELNAVIVIF